MLAVSVIIPNYNHARYLQQRIESVLFQTFTDFELIILDDLSTDNSKEIIEKYSKFDKRISFYPSAKNSGSPFAQWNKGVMLAKNDLIWIAESDDFCSSNLLQLLVNQHLQNPDIQLAYCQSNAVDEEGNLIGSLKIYTDDLDANLFKNDFRMEGFEFIANYLIHKNVILNASAVVFSKAAYLHIGGAKESLTTSGDWLVWLQMLCFGKVAFVSQPLNNFRRHRGSVIAKADAQPETTIYKEQYAGTMRILFEMFVNKNRVALPTSARQFNNLNISNDKAHKGFFYLRNRAFVKAWILILNASFFPYFRSGFIKKALLRL